MLLLLVLILILILVLLLIFLLILFLFFILILVLLLLLLLLFHFLGVGEIVFCFNIARVIPEGFFIGFNALIDLGLQKEAVAKVMVSPCFFDRFGSLAGQLFKTCCSIFEFCLFVYRIVQVEIPFRVGRFFIERFPVFRFCFAEVDGIQLGGIFYPFEVMAVSLADELAFLLSARAERQTGDEYDEE